MASLSRKRSAAEDTDEDQRVSPKVARKSKQGIEADGEDDDGNPFWEVRVLETFRIRVVCRISCPKILRTGTENSTAVKQTPGRCISVQEHVPR